MKKGIFFIGFLFLFISMGMSQEIGIFRTTKDFTMRNHEIYYEDAVGMHILGNYFFANKFDDVGLKWWQSDLATFSLGVLWEVKDGYIPVEQVPVIGGNGFSYSDLYVNAGIIITNRIFKFGINTIKKSFSKQHNRVRY